jgi:hypothetical protein
MTTTLRALACGALLLAVPVTAAGPREPVAIVYQVSGWVRRTVPGHDHDQELLRLFDRLPAEVTVQLSPRSSLTLAFVNGKRYEISGPIKVKLGPEDLAEKPAGVRELPPVPRLPHLASIAPSENPGEAAGAQWIRGEKMTGLYPRHAAATLAGETFLLFKRVRGAEEYRVEVRDGRGETVFQKDTETSPVKVPAEVLHSGSRYAWTVRTLNRPGPAVQGEGDFVTLSDEAFQTREKAREILTAEGKESLLLLVEIDRGLGLRLEARDELKEVIDEAPRDVALRSALATLEKQWKEEDEQE